MIAKSPNIQQRKPSIKWPSAPFICVAVGAIAAIGLMSYWLIGRDDNTNIRHADESEKRNHVKSLPAPSSRAQQQEAAKEIKETASESAERERRREMFSRMTAEEKIEYLREQLKNTPIPEVPTNRLYATGLEQTMDWIFSCEVGNPPPLLPPMSLFDQMHLAEILVMDNPILDTDSDKAVESKEMMKIAKKEFIQFLKDGGNPDEFLPYYHGQLVAAHDEYTAARQSIVEVIRNEPDIALEYIRKINDRLTEKGIKNVKIPKKMLDAFGIDSEDFE